MTRQMYGVEANESSSLKSSGVDVSVGVKATYWGVTAGVSNSTSTSNSTKNSISTSSKKINNTYIG